MKSVAKIKKCVCFLLCLCMSVPVNMEYHIREAQADNVEEIPRLNVEYHTKEEIKEYARTHHYFDAHYFEYDEDYSLKVPYAPGKLSQRTQDDSLEVLNFVRYLAGISDDVVYDEEAEKAVQAGMLVNAVNNELTHFPKQPADMDDDLYQLGCGGTSSSNISYSPYNLNFDIIYGWMADEDDGNIVMVGHRRWVLCQAMKRTAFGKVGRYGAMYVMGFDDVTYEPQIVSWPAQVMPASFFPGNYPWSVSVDERFIQNMDIQVELTNLNTGTVWNFSKSGSDGVFYLDDGDYARYGCIIFRPDNVEKYVDGDRYQVKITGLKNEISYVVEFFDLKREVIDTVTVEGIKEPVMGNSITTEGISVKEKGIEIDKAQWLDDGRVVEAGEKFLQGHEYTLDILYKPKSGYELSDTVTATVNTSLDGMESDVENKEIRVKYSIGPFSVRFDTNGGSSIDGQTVAKGKTAIKPQDPVRAPFVFDGWYEDQSCTTKYDFSKMLTKDTIIYAKWNRRGVEVIEGTSDIDTICGMDKTITAPQFTVTTGSPAYIATAVQGKWQKKNGQTWEDVTEGSFTAGVWRYCTQIRIDDAAAAEKYQLAENVSVKVNGQTWNVSDHQSTGMVTYATVYSTEYKLNVIDTVTIQGITAPFPYEEMTTEGITVQEEHISIDSIEWTCPDRGSWAMQFFFKGLEYKLCIQLKVEDGYALSDAAEIAANAVPDRDESVPLHQAVTLVYKIDYEELAFDTFGGSMVDRQLIRRGEQPVRPADPTRYGYVFEDWYEDDTFTTRFDFSKPLISSGSYTLIYANWIKKRTELSAITATSDMNTICALDHPVTAPTFTIPGVSAAYIAAANVGKWQKKDGSTWVDVTAGSFSEGTWRYCTQVRIDDERYTGENRLADTITLTVDEKEWSVLEVNISDTVSYAQVQSPEIEVKKVTHIHSAGTSVKENEVARTCEEAGSYESVVYCTVCGEEMSRTKETVAARGHIKGRTARENEVAASCESNGSYDRVDYCMMCGAEMGRTTIPIHATGHNWGEWIEIKPATGTETGTETRTCQNDKSHTETREIPVLEHVHQMKFVSGVEETCKKTGSKAHYQCVECKRLYSDGEGLSELNEEDIIIPVKEHSKGSEVRENEIAPRCETEGSYENAIYCTVCGEEISRRKVPVPAIGHSEGEPVKENEVLPGCEIPGSYERVIYCTACGKEIVRVKITVQESGHDWGEWVETKAATVKETGVETRTCQHDSSHQQTREIPLLSHIHNITEVEAVQPTCESAGNIKYYRCIECGRFFSDEKGIHEINQEDTIRPVTGHVEVRAVAENQIQPSCETDGSYDNVVYCTKCGKEISRTKMTLPAGGHDWGQWKVTKAPTKTQAGVETRICNLDHTHIETKEVPPLGEASDDIPVQGDSNGDGVVDVADALLISRYDARLIILETEQLLVSDVNGDGTVDVADALLISRYDAGLVSELR